MKKLYLIICSLACNSLLLFSQVIPTNEWVNFWGDSCLINHDLLPAGSIVRAYDPDGILCGQFTAVWDGSYGLMSVYRDDELTLVDEGAEPGDTITFTINSVTAIQTDIVIWNSNGNVKKNNLSLLEPSIVITPTNISLGNVPLYGTAYESIVIKNNGLKVLNVDSIVSTYHFPEFLTLSSTSASLNPGDSVNIVVSFSPALGSRNVTGNVTIHSNAVNAPSIVISVSAFIQSDIIATNEWISFWSNSTMFDDDSVQPGDVVDVFDPNGVHCGTFTVTTPGSYGLLTVYRDDATTLTIDEGAVPGDSLTFAINGFKAHPNGTGNPFWVSNGSVIKLNLEVIKSSVTVTATDLFPVIDPGNIIPVISLSFNSKLHNPKISSITAFRTGSATNDDVPNAKLFIDWNKNNLIDECDTQLGSTETFDSCSVTFDSLNFSPSESNNILLLFTVSNSANTTNSFGAMMCFNSITGDNNTTVIFDGIVTSDQSLQVELSSFSIEVRKYDTKISWQTQTENNNFGFELERRPKDENFWIKLASIPGHGNSNTPQNYSYVDKATSYRELIYRLKQIDNNGNVKIFESVSTKIEAPLNFSLQQNFPNPFNPSTTIRYTVPVSSNIRLAIYNTLGQQVAELVNQQQESGWQQVKWKANVSSGVYICRIQAVDINNPKNRFVETKKMVLMR